LDINIKNAFTKKYGLYLGIKRFAIPIIGVINSGKSTFLNQILNLNNILQIGDKVTTRFITIIRHDKNATIPEVYQVEIEKRNNEN
jgi:GTPase Era involved in 16S rRNA processing